MIKLLSIDDFEESGEEHGVYPELFAVDGAFDPLEYLLVV